MNAQSAALHQPIKILYPYHQVALMTAMLFMAVMSPEVREAGVVLYAGLILSWYLRIAWRLFRESWRDISLCSTETALSIAFAGWHGIIAMYFNIPTASTLAFMTVVTLGIYGWFCNEHRR